MPYVPDKLVSPLNTPILAYITNVTEEWVPEGRGLYARDKVKEVWSRLKPELQNWRRLGRAHRHHLLNRLSFDEIKSSAAELKEKRNVFTTALSVDQTPIDEEWKFYPTKPTGWDPFSNNARYTDEILRDVAKYGQKFEDKYKQKPKLNHIFWPVGPYLFPYVFKKTENKIVIEHLFPDVVEEVSKAMEEEGYRQYGRVIKSAGTNEPQIGNYEMAELLTSPEASKRATMGIIPGKGYELRFVYNSIPFILNNEYREKLIAYKADHPLEKNIVNILDEGLAKDYPYEQVTDWSTFFNRQIIAKPFLEARVIEPLELKRLEIVGEKSGYVSGIMQFYGKKYEMGWWDVHKNSDMPREGIADQSALNRIVGVMYNDWVAWKSN